MKRLPNFAIEVGTVSCVLALASCAQSSRLDGSDGEVDAGAGGRDAAVAAPSGTSNTPMPSATASAPTSPPATGDASRDASASIADASSAPAADVRSVTGDARPDEVLIGWASVSGDGVPTTTGGAAGRVVTAATADELTQFAASSEALVIQLEGDYSIPSLDVSSNKTLIGIGPTTIHGGVRIRGTADEAVSNVIVKGIRFDGASSGADGDAMHIYYAHHVWIDHCEFFDAPDGNLDIVHASNWVTVSWSKFSYTANAPAPDHRFSNLIGHSDDNATEDTDRLKVTFHHDWWASGVVERMPRVRFGEVHVFNCYYSAAGNNYAIGAGFESRLVIENNAFDGVNDPHIFYSGETTAQIVARDNAYLNTTGEQQSGQGSAFTPPYDYALDVADDVPAMVMQGAGPP